MSGHRHDMTDAEWAILRSVLPQTHQGPRRLQDRRVMDGIFFVLRTGIPWRDLPERYGPYSTCFNRCNRWSRNGTWARIMQALAERADDDDDANGGAVGPVRLRMLDSSVVRAHKHAAGARRDGPPPQIGLSRGGRTTKVHLALSGTDTVQALVLTPGQASDCAQAKALLADLVPGEMVLGDKAHDANAVVRCIEQAGAQANIPSRSCRKIPRPFDRTLYKGRNRIERFFGRIKEFRRVASRYDKTARNFLSAVQLAASRFLLRDLAKQLNGYTA